MILTSQFLKKRLNRKGHFFTKSRIIKRPYNYKKWNKSSQDSTYYGPVGSMHLNELAAFLKRSINVWSKGCLIHSFGKPSGKLQINVEYIENDCSRVGHYTLNNSLEPSIVYKYPNNCLYDAVAVQTDIDAIVLRQMVIKRMRRQFKKKRIPVDFAWKNNPSFNFDLLGGAKYRGKSANDAKIILDLSQNGESHPLKKNGHPRGHASNSIATGHTDSVENYSIGTWKTGFLSRSDQNYLAHLALRTDSAQDQMEVLNDSKNFQVTTVIKAKDLDADTDELPKMQEWLNGNKIGDPYKIHELLIIMKHFYKKHNDEKHDVFVFTFYPKA